MNETDKLTIDFLLKIWYNNYIKRKGKEKMKKTLERLVMIITIIWLVWFGLSYFEVICKNTTINPQYSFWNLFEILFRQ